MMSFIAHAVAVALQTHDLKHAEALKQLEFMKGAWSGQQVFDTQGGPEMKGAAKNTIDDAIGGRYLCEMLSTTLPGRKPTDTRHFITFDPKSQSYKAWWYTDTSVGPMEFEGKLTNGTLVLLSKPTATGAILKASYATPAASTLTYTLEMKTESGWQRLFVTTYKK